MNNLLGYGMLLPHASGFVIPAHGTDEPFCRYIVKHTDYTVLDVQYRLAPEHPFPAALHDIEDAIRWVCRQSETFDFSRFSLSGFSAGANLTLAAAATSETGSPHGQDKQTFRSVVSFYPGLDSLVDPGSGTAPDASGRPLPMIISRLFRRCYMQGQVDPRDPRVCPSRQYVDDHGRVR